MISEGGKRCGAPRQAGKNFSHPAVAEGALSVEESKMKRKEWTAKRAEGRLYDRDQPHRQAGGRELTGAETRICVPGHMQRGGSPSAYDRVLATQFGTYAAGLVADEHYGVTVAMVNRSVTAQPAHRHCRQDPQRAGRLRHAQCGALDGGQPGLKSAASTKQGRWRQGNLPAGRPCFCFIPCAHGNVCMLTTMRTATTESG